MTPAFRLDLLKRLMAAPVSDGAKLFIYWFFQFTNDADKIPCDWHSNKVYAALMGRADRDSISRYITEWVDLGILRRLAADRPGIFKLTKDHKRSMRSRPTQNRVLVLNVKEAQKLPAPDKIVSLATTGSEQDGLIATGSEQVGTTGSEQVGTTGSEQDQTGEALTGEVRTGEGESVAASPLPPPPVASSTLPEPASQAEEEQQGCGQEFPGEREPTKHATLIGEWFPELDSFWRTFLAEQAGVPTDRAVPRALQKRLWEQCRQFIEDQRASAEKEERTAAERKLKAHQQTARTWVRGLDRSTIRVDRLRRLYDLFENGEEPAESDWSYLLQTVQEVPCGV